MFFIFRPFSCSVLSLFLGRFNRFKCIFLLPTQQLWCMYMVIQWCNTWFWTKKYRNSKFKLRIECNFEFSTPRNHSRNHFQFKISQTGRQHTRNWSDKIRSHAGEWVWTWYSTRAKSKLFKIVSSSVEILSYRKCVSNHIEYICFVLFCFFRNSIFLRDVRMLSCLFSTFSE